MSTYLDGSHCDLIQWIETSHALIYNPTMDLLSVVQLVSAIVCMVAQVASSSAALRVSLASYNSTQFVPANNISSRGVDFVWVRRLCALLWRYPAIKGAASKDARVMTRVIKHACARLLSLTSLQDSSNRESQGLQSNIQYPLISHLSRWCSWKDAVLSLLERSGQDATSPRDSCILVVIELLWRWCANGNLPFDDFDNFSHIFDTDAHLSIRNNQGTLSRAERDEAESGNAIIQFTADNVPPIGHDMCLCNPGLAYRIINEDDTSQTTLFVFEHVIEPHDLSSKLVLVALKECRNGAWMLSASTSAGCNPSGKSLHRSLALAIGYSNLNFGDHRRTSSHIKGTCMVLLENLTLEDACDVAAALSGMVNVAESESSVGGGDNECFTTPIASSVSEWLSRLLRPGNIISEFVSTASQSPVFDLLEDRLVWESRHFTSIVEDALRSRFESETTHISSLPVEENTPQSLLGFSRGALLLNAVVAIRCNSMLPLPTPPPSTRFRGSNSTTISPRRGSRHNEILDATLSTFRQDVEALRISDDVDHSLHLMSTQRLVATFLLDGACNDLAADSRLLSQWFRKPMEMPSLSVSAAVGAFVEYLLQPTCVAILSEALKNRPTATGVIGMSNASEECAGNYAANEVKNLHRRRLRGLAFLAEATDTGLDESVLDELVNLSHWVGSNLVPPPLVHEAASVSDVFASATSSPRLLSTLALEGFLLRLFEAAATSSPSLNAAARQLLEATAHAAAAAATKAVGSNDAATFAFSTAATVAGGTNSLRKESVRIAQHDLMQRLAPWLPASPALGALASMWLMQPNLFSARASTTSHFGQHKSWNESCSGSREENSHRSELDAPLAVAACLDFCAALRPVPHEWALRLFTVPALARAACPSLVAAAINGAVDDSIDESSSSSSNDGSASTSLLGTWRAAAEHLWCRSGVVENCSAAWSVQQRDDVRRGLRQALPLLAGGALWLSVCAVTAGQSGSSGSDGEEELSPKGFRGEIPAARDGFTVEGGLTEYSRRSSGNDDDYRNSTDARRRWQALMCEVWNSEGLIVECAGEINGKEDEDNEAIDSSTEAAPSDGAEILLVVEEGTGGAWRSVGLKQRHGYFERYAAAAAQTSVEPKAAASTSAGGAGAADHYRCWRRVGPSYCSANKCRNDDDDVDNDADSNGRSCHELSPVSVLLGPWVPPQPADTFRAVRSFATPAPAGTGSESSPHRPPSPRAAAALPLAPFLKALLLAPSPSNGGAAHGVDTNQFESPGRPTLTSPSAAGAGLRPWLLRLLDGFYCPVQFGGSSTTLLAASLQVWLTTSSPSPYGEESHAAVAVSECLLSLAAAAEPECAGEDDVNSEDVHDVPNDASTLIESSSRGVKGLGLLQSLMATAAAQAEDELPLVGGRWAALLAALPLRTLAGCPPMPFHTLSSSSSQTLSPLLRSPAHESGSIDSSIDESVMVWHSRGEEAVSLLVSLASHLRALSLPSTRDNPDAPWDDGSAMSSNFDHNGGIGEHNLGGDEGDSDDAEAVALAFADECLGPLAAAALAWADAALLWASPSPPSSVILNSRSSSSSSPAAASPARRSPLSLETRHFLKEFARRCAEAATAIVTGDDSCRNSSSSSRDVAKPPTSPHATVPASPSTATATACHGEHALPAPILSPFEATIAARAWAAADSLARAHRFTAALRLWTALAITRSDVLDNRSSVGSSSGITNSGNSRRTRLSAIARAAQDVTPRRRRILHPPTREEAWRGRSGEIPEMQPSPGLDAPPWPHAPPPQLPSHHDQGAYEAYEHAPQGDHVYQRAPLPEGFDAQSSENAWPTLHRWSRDARTGWPEPPPPMPPPMTQQEFAHTPGAQDSRGDAPAETMPSEPQFTRHDVNSVEHSSFEGHEQQPLSAQPLPVELPWQACSPDASSRDNGQSLHVTQNHADGAHSGGGHRLSSPGTPSGGDLNTSPNRGREDAALNEVVERASHSRPNGVKSGTKRAKAAAPTGEMPPIELPSPPKPKRISGSSNAKKNGGHDRKGSSISSSSSNGKRRQVESNKIHPAPLDFLQAIPHKDGKRRRK